MCVYVCVCVCVMYVCVCVCVCYVRVYVCVCVMYAHTHVRKSNIESTYVNVLLSIGEMYSSISIAEAWLISRSS